MARSRRFTQSVLLGYATQAIFLLTGLWLTPFLLHHIGATRYGLWVVGQQILVYFGLMDFGTVALLPRETGYAVGRAGSPEAARDLPDLLARTARIVLLQTPLVALAGALLWWRMPHSWASLREPIGLIVIAFTATFPFRIFRAVLDGLQDLAFIGWAYLVSWLFGTALTVALVLNGHGLNALAAGWAVVQTLNSIVCYGRLRRKYPFVLPRRWLATSGPVSAHADKGLWVSVGQLAQVLITGTDALVIGRLFGPAAIVPYNCTGKLITVLANQPQLLTQAAGPGLSEMRTSQTRERLAQVTGALSLAMLLVTGLVVCVTLAVNTSFVRIWVGPGLYSGLLLTALFAASIVMRHLNITVTYALFAFGHERRLAITNLVDGVLSTAISIGLALAMHSVLGVVLGSLISSFCIYCLGNGPALARELGLKFSGILRPLAPWAWRIALISAAACAAATWIVPANLPMVAALGAATAAIYIALMFPVAMRSTLGVYLEPYLRRSPRPAALAKSAAKAA